MGDFFWIGGELWLDAVNSEWISNGQRIEGWPDVAALQDWLQQAATQHAEAEALRDINLTDGEALLQGARQLRAALRAGCEAAHQGHDLALGSLAQINAALAQGGIASRLESTADGWQERELLVDRATGPLWLLACSAARSWASGDLKRLKPCANPDCILWFLDTSKNGTRRWCSMQACGNRHKVTAHYERRKHSTDGAD